MTVWQDALDKEHFFRQVNNETWEEMTNGSRYATFNFLKSPISQTVNLFESKRNFYIQLKCGIATWGHHLSTITQTWLSMGYWTDKRGSNICSSFLSNYEQFVYL